MKVCPVLHIIGIPELFSTDSDKSFEHFTSNTIFDLGLRFRILSANIIICISGYIIFPLLETTPSLSASPSKANPISKLALSTKSIRSLRFSGLEGSGWWLGKFPSSSQ